MTQAETEWLRAHSGQGVRVGDRALKTHFATTRAPSADSVQPDAQVGSAPRRYRVELGVSQRERPVIDRGPAARTPIDERAARSSLRAQVARLERDLSAMVVSGFPHISPIRGSRAFNGSRLLGLKELERLRDELTGQVQDLGGRVAERIEHERRAHELLEDMKLEPGRYKFVHLSVNDLGQGGCGVWQVRPRLGLIGMLAGWWQVKLSSGCPLPKGRAPRAAPQQELVAITPLRPRPVPVTLRRIRPPLWVTDWVTTGAQRPPERAPTARGGPELRRPRAWGGP